MKSWMDVLPQFNLKEEADDICELCKTEVPAETHFVGPVCIGDQYKDLCPRCAKGIRNLLLGQNPDVMFPSNDTNRLYNRYISWLTQQKKED